MQNVVVLAQKEFSIVDSRENLLTPSQKDERQGLELVGLLREPLKTSATAYHVQLPLKVSAEKQFRKQCPAVAGSPSDQSEGRSVSA